MKTRASKQKQAFAYPKLAEYTLQHNVANDMLRVVRWASEAKKKDFNRVFAAYTRPLITLIFACSSIEGYVNYVGQKLMPCWSAFLKGQTPGQRRRPGIKDKITAIYRTLGKRAAFSSGIFQQVSDLFEKRGYLMHPSLDERTFVGRAPPADILEMIGEDYAPERVLALASRFVKKLLSDSNVLDHTWSLGYSEKLK